jgi:hypothetical protein
MHCRGAPARALREIGQRELHWFASADADPSVGEKRNRFGGAVEASAQIALDARPSAFFVHERFRVPDHSAGHQRVDRRPIGWTNPQREPVFAHFSRELRRPSNRNQSPTISTPTRSQSSNASSALCVASRTVHPEPARRPREGIAE